LKATVDAEVMIVDLNNGKPPGSFL
jgi:hypothetical protein